MNRSLDRGSTPLASTNKKTSFVYLTKEVFLNDVCLRQLVLATPMMTALPNDACLTAHWANIASLRVKRATSYRVSDISLKIAMNYDNMN